MQVSTVSANEFKTNSTLNTNVSNISSQESPAYFFLTTFQNKQISQNKELYNCIMEWKDFCHQQIMNNNIDYLA